MGTDIDFAHLAGPIENDLVKEWKAGGGRVVGFFCSHAPEELLWAAGILPVRMRGTGSDDMSYADQYLGSFNCSFVRHTLDRMLRGDLAFLDGLLISGDRFCKVLDGPGHTAVLQEHLVSPGSGPDIPQVLRLSLHFESHVRTLVRIKGFEVQDLNPASRKPCQFLRLSEKSLTPFIMLRH